MPDRNERRPDDLACIELVETLTDYLEGEVDEGRRATIERHLEGCGGCRAALDQLQMVIRLAGRLTEEDVAKIDALALDPHETALPAVRRC